MRGSRFCTVGTSATGKGSERHDAGADEYSRATKRLSGLRPVILNVMPYSLGRHLDMLLFIASKGRVQRTEGYGDPVGVSALVI